MSCELKTIRQWTLVIEKSYVKCVGEASPGPFSEKLKLSNLWINSLKFYTVCFYYMPSWGLSKYAENKLHTTCLYIIIKLFFKKNVWN